MNRHEVGYFHIRSKIKFNMATGMFQLTAVVASPSISLSRFIKCHPYKFLFTLYGGPI